jgi:hypothetical protein
MIKATYQWSPTPIICSAVDFEHNVSMINGCTIIKDWVVMAVVVQCWYNAWPFWGGQSVGQGGSVSWSVSKNTLIVLVNNDNTWAISFNIWFKLNHDSLARQFHHHPIELGLSLGIIEYQNLSDWSSGFLNFKVLDLKCNYTSTVLHDLALPSVYN